MTDREHPTQRDAAPDRRRELVEDAWLRAALCELEETRGSGRGGRGGRGREPQVAEAFATSEGAGARAANPRRWRPWAAAAVLALGVGVLASIALDRREPAADTAAGGRIGSPGGQDPQPDATPKLAPRRVLWTGVPSWDYRYGWNSLRRMDGVVAAAVGEHEQQLPETVEALRGYDAVFVLDLAPVDGAEAERRRTGYLDALVRFAHDGGGVFLQVGPELARAAADHAGLKALLPLVVEAPDRADGAGQLQRPAKTRIPFAQMRVGALHSVGLVLRGDRENRDDSEPPPGPGVEQWLGVRATGVREGALRVWTAFEEGTGTELVGLAVGSYGRGRVVACTVATWRLRAVEDDAEQHFWAAALDYLAPPTARAEPEPGRSGKGR